MNAESWWTNIETFLAGRAVDALAESKCTFTTHCAFSSDFIHRCHSFDARCFPYVTFYVGADNAEWNHTNFSVYQGVDFSKHNFWEIGPSGSPNRSPFGFPNTGDGVGMMLNPCYITCPNVLDYQNKMVEWVDLIMRRGADGVFVDNLFARQPCFGAKNGIHPHIFPDPANGDASAQNQAFAALLKRVRAVVKKYKPDGRILGNSGDPLNLPLEFQQYIDSDMIEEYVCSSGTRVTSWHGMTWDAAGRELQAYLARKKQILVISDIALTLPDGQFREPSQIAEDAFLCYATARLAGFVWTSNVVTEATNSLGVLNLFSLRLGEPITEEQTDSATGINYRVFSRGLVAVNPDQANDKVLTIRPPIIGNVFVDVFNAGQSTTILPVPKYSGRVFLFGGALDFGQGILTP